MDALRVDERRLWDSHLEMAKIGATANGGVGRISLTDLDRESRDLFVAWCRDAGLTVRVDQVGNIIARRAGVDESRSPIMTGSHLDTQPLGGRFDGSYGVLAGLEVVRTLNDAGVDTLAPIDIVNWTDEEGVRFGAGTIGSRVFSGRYRLDEALGKVDADGVTVGEALTRIGYAGDEPAGGYPVGAFFEVHIEQGPILEKAALPVGVVLGAQGQRLFQVTVEGDEGHAGTLPMDQRRDALLGAARMIDAVNLVAFRYKPYPVITVGNIRVRPNSRNTISGQTVFSIDSRYPDDDALAEIAVAMRDACEEIALEAGLGLEFREISARGTVAFDEGVIETIRGAAERLQIFNQDIFSGAGHDACNMADVAPTAMIFVPCEDGISHNEKENARPQDLAAGCNVLLHAMLERAGTA